MSGYVIEGTWEEIKRHEAELIGQYLRVTVKPRPQKRAAEKEATADQETSDPPKKKVLRAFGAFADALPSSEEYMREKRAEIEIEERNF